MRIRGGRDDRKRRAGSAVVEFALAFPVLVALCLGVIETGNLFFSWLTVQKAATMGTRLATTGLGWDDGTRLTRIRSEVARLLENLPGEGESQTLVQSWDTTNTSGEPRDENAGLPCDVVAVKVLYAYRPITPIVGSLMPEIIPLAGEDRKINEPWLPCD